MVWGLYILACAMPAIEPGPALSGIRDSRAGWEALLLGWIPPYCIPWSANLLLIVGWIFLLCGRFKTAAWLGGAGALVALTTWGFDFPHLLAGYYLWEASLVALATGAAVLALVGAAPRARARVVKSGGVLLLLATAVIVPWATMLYMRHRAFQELEQLGNVYKIGRAHV